jgi:hypothetical protein
MFRPTGTFIAYEDGEINDKRYKKRIATSSDWRAYNSDKSVTIGMGTDGNFYVLEPTPQESTKKSSDYNPVKIAEPEIVKAVHEKAYSNEKELDPLFEQLGLQEILSVTRNSAANIVNGQNVTYQPIKNLASISLQYNPLNILPLQSAETTFKNFSISLQDKLIEDGQGTGPGGATEYLDSSNNLVINVTNLQPDELVEIESLSIERTINDTMYTGES